MNKLTLILSGGLFLAFCSLSQAQVLSDRALADKYVSLKRKYEKLISIGSSIDEVKSKLGKPVAVQSGFPDTDEFFVSSLPEFHGQLNYTSFVYQLSGIFTRSWKEHEESETVVDGYPISEKVWQLYAKRDSISFTTRKRHYVKIQYPSGSKPDLEVDESLSVSPLSVGATVGVTRLGNGEFALGIAKPGEIVGVILATFDSTEILGVSITLGQDSQFSKPKEQCVIRRTPPKEVTHKLVYSPILFVLIDRGTQVVTNIRILFVGV